MRKSYKQQGIKEGIDEVVQRGRKEGRQEGICAMAKICYKKRRI